MVKTIYETFHSAATKEATKECRMTAKKGETIFLPKYDCIRHFDLSLMLCCKLHVTFISYKITYILHNENIFI